MNIKIRNFNLGDTKFVWMLRNDFSSRKMSINSSYINYKNHLHWIKKYKNKENKIFIGFIKKRNDRIGYVRFDANGLLTEVSICLSKKYRNKLLSDKFLFEAEKKLHKDTILIAKVRKNNKASIKLFSKLNYQILSTKKFITFIKIYRFKKKQMNYLKIINEIQNIRKKNNKNWMDILRVAFSYAPDDSKSIFNQIYLDDKKISKLSKQLTKS